MKIVFWLLIWYTSEHNAWKFHEMQFSEDNFLLKLTGMARLQSNKDTHDEGKKKDREVEK